MKYTVLMLMARAARKSENRQNLLLEAIAEQLMLANALQVGALSRDRLEEMKTEFRAAARLGEGAESARGAQGRTSSRRGRDGAAGVGESSLDGGAGGGDDHAGGADANAR